MTCGLATALDPPHFNHAPVRGAIGASFSRRSRAGSFNPRTRVGCDVSVLTLIRARLLFQSTHPRGVRQVMMESKQWDFSVSIHAPAWGATRSSKVRKSAGTGFNPRTRVGCDHEAHFFAARQVVSIHAPAWGATSPAFDWSPECWVSIHAPAWGATAMMAAMPAPAFSFQSTHPRGVRHAPHAGFRLRMPCFNPRTRVGCDAHSAVLIRGRARVSIHAPAWGATGCSWAATSWLC